MNTFKTLFYDETSQFDLRDIVGWDFEGKRSPEYMVTQMNGKIFFVDTKTAISHDISFESLEKANEYLRKLKVDNKEIRVVSSDEWVVYVP